MSYLVIPGEPDPVEAWRDDPDLALILSRSLARSLLRQVVLLYGEPGISHPVEDEKKEH
jgi:hypothetical protein